MIIKKTELVCVLNPECNLSSDKTKTASVQDVFLQSSSVESICENQLSTADVTHMKPVLFRGGPGGAPPFQSKVLLDPDWL